MNRIEVSSPTRVDLSGGTLDLWPLFNFVGGRAKTINLAISVMTHATLEKKSVDEIHLKSQDIDLDQKFANAAEFLNSKDPRIKYYQIMHRYFSPNFGYAMTTSSQSPVGGGLGGSSSLLISMMKAFSLLCGRHWNSPEELVTVAHNLESQLLYTPTGTQDYYPAIQGGLCAIQYAENGMRLEYLEMDPIWSERATIVYTGRSHHSGLNNFEVLQGSVKQDEKTINALMALQRISEETYRVCQSKDWAQLPKLFRSEYQERVKLAKAFSSPEIETLSTLALREGAEAVKICGAGGGGCVLIWSPASHRERVNEKCLKEGFQVLTAAPVPKSPLKGLFKDF